VKLKHLDAWTEARQRNAAYYSAAFERAGLAPHIVTPRARAGRHIFNQYAIRAERRDELRAALTERGIGPRSTIPCRCIYSNVLPTSATSRATSRIRARRRRDAGCRFIRSSQRRSSPTWSRPSRSSTADLERAPSALLEVVRLQLMA